MYLNVIINDIAERTVVVRGNYLQLGGIGGCGWSGRGMGGIATIGR